MTQGDGGVTLMRRFTLPARCARAPSLKGGPEEGGGLCTALHGSRFKADRSVRRCSGFRDPSIHRQKPVEDRTAIGSYR